MGSLVLKRVEASGHRRRFTLLASLGAWVSDELVYRRHSVTTLLLYQIDPIWSSSLNVLLVSEAGTSWYQASDNDVFFEATELIGLTACCSTNKHLGCFLEARCG